MRNFRMSHIWKKISCLSMGAALSLGLISGCSGQGGNDVIINEVMSGNHATLTDSEGAYYDWIELHNPGKHPASLTGFSLSDNEKKPRKWSFPDGTEIPADGYLIVFCSGKSSETEELHAPFRISTKGETLLLSDPGGRIVSRMEVPEMPAEISCGYAGHGDGQPVFFSQATPGKPNSEHYSTDLENLTFDEFTLRINEYTSVKLHGFYDSDGDCPTWVELYNYGTEPIDLTGMHLSDQPGDPTKWTFPAGVEIAPDGYCLVLLSGKDKPYDGKELHASFKFGAQDVGLLLSDQTMHQVDFAEQLPTKGSVSVGRDLQDPERWVYFARPTPGSPNDTEAFETLAAGTSLPARGVWINEVMSTGARRADVATDRNDWIELHNGTDQPVDLTGYCLSDSADEPSKYCFPATELGPGEYLVLEANGREPTGSAPYQVPFQISNTGETLYLLRSDGTLCDAFETGRQRNGVSSGRGSGPDDTRFFFEHPTKGGANGTGCTGYTDLPVFSVESVYVENGVQIELSAPEGQEIRYTTDGSDPTRQSALYAGPITIGRDTSLRAAAFADGLIPGGVTTHTYLVGERHQLPVICLSTNRDNLFDFNRGIYADGPGKSETFPHVGANYWKEWERPIHFEYYEEDGSPGVGFDAGVMIFGQYSRAIPQKSLAIHLREAYGQGEVHYPFFPDNPVTEYHDLLLRTSGQDWNQSKLRDALTHMIVKGQMDLDIMDYRPVVLYINGEYWGLYNLRDKVNEDYLATHRGIDPDQVDIIKGNHAVLSGNSQAYDEMRDYIRTHDLSIQSNYDYVCSIVDVDEVMNYWITETFFANTDTGNIKYYRERTPDGKWRLILFDLDWALSPSTYTWDMIRQALDARGHGVGKMFWTGLLRGLMDNPGFRQKFIETYAYHLNHTFAPERTSSILRQMAAVIESEIPRQYERWETPSVKGWNNQINFLEKALASRVEECKRNLKNNFNLSESEMARLFPQGYEEASE